MFIHKFNIRPADGNFELYVVIYFETNEGERYWGLWENPTPDRLRQVVGVLCLCDDEIDIDYERSAAEVPGDERTSIGLSVADSKKLGFDDSEPYEYVFINDVRDSFQRD